MNTDLPFLIGSEVGQNPGQWPKEKDNDDDDDEKLNLNEQLYFLNSWMAVSFSNQINPCGIARYVSLFCRILLPKVFSFHLLLQHDLQVHLPLHTHTHTQTLHSEKQQFRMYVFMEL